MASIIPVSSLDECGVLQSAIGKLGEGAAEGGDSLRLHLEAALLRHGGIPTGRPVSTAARQVEHKSYM